MTPRPSKDNRLITWFWNNGITTITSLLLIIKLRHLLNGLNLKPGNNGLRSSGTLINHSPYPKGIRQFILTQKPEITFNDIGGLAVVKETIKLEVVYPHLKRDLYELYNRLPGCGVLLYGPPGCGKTLLAKAIATEVGNTTTTVITPPISTIMSRWVGRSEKIITQIFTYAHTCNNAIIFLDEIDALLPRNGPSYMRRIKNTFLQCMDGINSKHKDLLLLGATNKPWLLDPATRRPGRFGKLIMIPPPDTQARKQIFRLHLQPLITKELIDSNVTLDELALATKGYSGADIKAICEEAKDIPLQEAVHGNAIRPITNNDFTHVMSHRKPSIIPWITDALRAIKRYKAEEFYQPVLDIATTFQQH